MLSAMISVSRSMAAKVSGNWHGLRSEPSRLTAFGGWKKVSSIDNCETRAKNTTPLVATGAAQKNFAARRASSGGWS